MIATAFGHSPQTRIPHRNGMPTFYRVHDMRAHLFRKDKEIITQNALICVFPEPFINKKITFPAKKIKHDLSIDDSVNAKISSIHSFNTSAILPIPKDFLRSLPSARFNKSKIRQEIAPFTHSLNNSINRHDFTLTKHHYYYLNNLLLILTILPPLF